MSNLKELLKQHRNEGARFQEKLGQFVYDNKLQNIVETGAGVTSLFIVEALERRDIGKLYSIDPAPWHPSRLSHPQYELFEKCSDECLFDAYKNSGPWDLAVSDGNHDIRAQTYEYEFMYAALKPGGYLIADDSEWGNHGAWKKFLANHDLKEDFFGDARIIQKPVEIPVYATEEYNKKCLELAQQAEETFLANGGQNSSLEWVRV